jgi:hypothetical protein
LLAAVAGLITLLRPGSVAAMVPAEGGCSVISGGESATLVEVPGTGEGTPGAGAKLDLISAECSHLARVQSTVLRLSLLSSASDM